MKHIICSSFGKDSNATALLALQHGEPLDEIIYTEVMFSKEISGELPEHTRFLYETAIPYFEKRGIPTRVLHAEKTYLDCFYHVVSRGNAQGKLAAFPLAGRCVIQRDCKVPPLEAYKESLPPGTVSYLGLAADEPIRLERLKPDQVSLTTQELFQPGGLYEGINARSKNLILCNRKLLPAPAGMVLGMTGYGKSFSVMQMVTNIMLRWPDDDIVLIDPEQEYTHLVTAMGGVVIDISASSPSHINPMDITEDYGDDEDPIRLKSQFLQNFCQLILHSSELSPQERTFIDVAASLTYQRYMANPKREEMPTLHDFYRNLALQGEEVKPLLTALKLYVSGSMDLFAYQTNVNVQNHCICFNTVKLGKSMQSIGMLTVLDQVWNRITRNRVLGRRTWVFTDEFQQLLGNKDCTDFYFQLSSRARKWGAILTSITQHVRSVLDNEDARRMLSDCGYIKLLNQSPDDANDLARLLHISNEEKRYIENAEVGSGLLIVSKTVVPFNNDFPKDTELFRLMDTSPNQKS